MRPIDFEQDHKITVHILGASFSGVMTLDAIEMTDDSELRMLVGPDAWLVVTWDSITAIEY